MLGGEHPPGEIPDTTLTDQIETVLIQFFKNNAVVNKLKTVHSEDWIRTRPTTECRLTEIVQSNTPAPPITYRHPEITRVRKQISLGYTFIEATPRSNLAE